MTKQDLLECGMDIACCLLASALAGIGCVLMGIIVWIVLATIGG